VALASGRLLACLLAKVLFIRIKLIQLKETQDKTAIRDKHRRELVGEGQALEACCIGH
jgi:hypothetical protein